MAYSPLSVANAFIDLANAEGLLLTNMKLQKLLYFAEGHHLAHRQRKLLDEVPFAWRYGPVYRSVYDAFKYCGADEITEHAVDPFPDEWGDYTYPAIQNEVDLKFIRSVWDAYKLKSANQLSSMSHVPDGPWAEAREFGENEPISSKSMLRYFTELKDRAAHAPAA